MLFSLSPFIKGIFVLGRQGGGDTSQFRAEEEHIWDYIETADTNLKYKILIKHSLQSRQGCFVHRLSFDIFSY